jgi:hypothetical protein
LREHYAGGVDGLQALLLAVSGLRAELHVLARKGELTWLDGGLGLELVGPAAETLRSVKAVLIAVAFTALIVVIIQVAARLITGRTIGGVAVAVGVPVAFTVLWSTGLLRRRKSG